MRRSSRLNVIDRRSVLVGMAALIAGCRLSLDHAEPDAAPDAPPAPPPGVDAPGNGVQDCGGQLCLDLTAAANAALRDVDGARIITVNGRPLIVVRTGDTTFAALSAVCTHAGCTVRYAVSAHDIACPCHGSTFALDGKVTRGPAVLPLAQFMATFDATTQILTIAT
jgi:cytochrome b6-f complex iron-sulfur subunit